MYHTQFGFHPKIEAIFTMFGPQEANQIPEEVRKLLDNPKITQVVIMMGNVITVYSKEKSNGLPEVQQ